MQVESDPTLTTHISSHPIPSRFYFIPSQRNETKQNKTQRNPPPDRTECDRKLVNQEESLTKKNEKLVKEIEELKRELRVKNRSALSTVQAQAKPSYMKETTSTRQRARKQGHSHGSSSGSTGSGSGSGSGSSSGSNARDKGGKERQENNDPHAHGNDGGAGAGSGSGSAHSSSGSRSASPAFGGSGMAGALVGDEREKARRAQQASKQVSVFERLSTTHTGKGNKRAKKGKKNSIGEVGEGYAARHGTRK